MLHFIIELAGLITNALTKDTLVDLYFRQNKSLQDIAKEYNCTRQMVKLLMEKYGLTRRKRSKARVLAIREGKFKDFKYDPINENFFSEWTPQMAWVLGLLFTDGYISEAGTGLRACPGQKVVLNSIDRDMLENVRAHLKSTRPIKKQVQSYDKTKYIYKLEFYRERMRDNLISLGLMQRKSLAMRFPDVPDKFMRHFIRGCWDGDGSVYIDKDNKLNASYVTGSHEFIKQMVVELTKVGITRQREESFLNIHKDKRSKAYSIKLNSRKNMETLFYFFYDNVDETIFLKRKYDVFVRGLSILKEKMQRHNEEWRELKEEIQRHYRVVSKDHIDNFLKYLEVERAASAHTLRAYRKDLDEFFNYVKEKPKDIEIIDERDFIAEQIKRNLKESSIRRRIASVRSFFKYICRESFIESSPASHLTIFRKSKNSDHLKKIKNRINQNTLHK